MNGLLPDMPVENVPTCTEETGVPPSIVIIELPQADSAEVPPAAIAAADVLIKKRRRALLVRSLILQRNTMHLSPSTLDAARRSRTSRD
jgi:hypothetical protein